MISDLKDFIQTALEDSTQFKNIVTTSDDRWADYDANPPSAAYAIKIDDVQNLDQFGTQIWIFVRFLILVSDHSQQRATTKFVEMHSQITGEYCEFSDSDKYVQEDLFQLVEEANNPETLVNLPNEFTFGVEYEGKITVDTTV